MTTSIQVGGIQAELRGNWAERRGQCSGWGNNLQVPGRPNSHVRPENKPALAELELTLTALVEGSLAVKQH